MTVKDLENKDLQFIEVDCDVDEIKKYIGRRAKEFDSFFVRVEDGEYAEVYGMKGTVPYLNRAVEQLVPDTRRKRNRWYKVTVFQECFYFKTKADSIREAKNQAWIEISAMRLDLNDPMRVEAEEITKEEYEIQE